jgi:hypothetical protein
LFVRSESSAITSQSKDVKKNYNELVETESGRRKVCDKAQLSIDKVDRIEMEGSKAVCSGNAIAIKSQKWNDKARAKVSGLEATNKVEWKCERIGQDKVNCGNNNSKSNQQYLKRNESESSNGLEVAKKCDTQRKLIRGETSRRQKQRIT